jgi:transcriptional regulator with XRE-family HTH domain
MMTPAELREIMNRQGWTQGDLARLLPMKSTRTVRYWLSGERQIRPLVAERIRSLAKDGPALRRDIHVRSTKTRPNPGRNRPKCSNEHSLRRRNL